MAQQTAVEWLMEQVNSEQYQMAFGQTYISIDLIEKAKQIEKEQLKDAYWNGTIDIEKEDAMSEAEDFYNAYYTK